MLRISSYILALCLLCAQAFFVCANALGNSRPPLCHLAPISQTKNPEIVEKEQAHNDLLNILWVITQMLETGQQPTRDQVNTAAAYAGKLLGITDAHGVFDSRLQGIRIPIKDTIRKHPAVRGKLRTLGLADRMIVGITLQEGQLILLPKMIQRPEGIPPRAFAAPRDNIRDAFSYFDNKFLKELAKRLERRGVSPELVQEVIRHLESLKGVIKYNAAGQIVSDNYVLGFLYELMRFAGLEKNTQTYMRFIRELVFHELVHDYLRHQGRPLAQALTKDTEFGPMRTRFSQAFQIPQGVSDQDVAEEIMAKAASYLFEGEHSTWVYGEEIRRDIESWIQRVSQTQEPYDTACRQIFHRIALSLPIAKEGPDRESAQKILFYDLRKSVHEKRPEDIKKITRLAEEVEDLDDLHRVTGLIMNSHLLLRKLYKERKVGAIAPEAPAYLEKFRRDLIGLFLQAMDHPSEEVRDHAIRELTKMDVVEGAVPILSILEQDVPKPPKALILASIRALGKLGNVSDRIREVLGRYTQDTDREVQKEALMALFLQERRLGLYSMLEMRWKIEPTLKRLLDMAKSTEAAEQFLAVSVLAELGEERTAETLKEFSQSKDTMLAQIALEGLKKMGLDQRSGSREKRKSMAGMLQEYLEGIHDGDSVSLVYRPDTGGTMAASLMARMIEKSGKKVHWHWVPFGFEVEGVERGIKTSQHVIVVDIPFPAQTAEHHDLLYTLGHKGRFLWVDNWDNFVDRVPEDTYGIRYISPGRLGSSLPSGRYPTAKIINDLARDLKIPGFQDGDDWRTAVALSVDSHRHFWMDVFHEEPHAGNLPLYERLGELMNAVQWAPQTDVSLVLFQELLQVESVEDFAQAHLKQWERLEKVARKVQRLSNNIIERMSQADPGSFVLMHIHKEKAESEGVLWDLGTLLSREVYEHRVGGTPRTVFLIQEIVLKNRLGFYVHGVQAGDPGQETEHVGKILFDLFGGNGVLDRGRVLLFPRPGQRPWVLYREIEKKLQTYGVERSVLRDYHGVLEGVLDHIEADEDLSKNPVRALDYIAEQTPPVAPFATLRQEFLQMKFQGTEDFKKTVQRLVFFRQLTPEIGRRLLLLKEGNTPHQDSVRDPDPTGTSP